jgi:AAA+ ATPase superfamily predicted ATPase
MKFNLNKDLLSSNKILTICGSDNTGKTQLILKIIKYLDYKYIYINPDGDVNKKITNNPNSSIVHTTDLNGIYDLVKDLTNYKDDLKKSLFVIDSLSSLSINHRSGDLLIKPKIISKLLNLMYDIQNKSDIKFIMSVHSYYNINSNGITFPNYVGLSFCNYVKINNYDEIKNMNFEKQMRGLKLKNILL